MNVTGGVSCTGVQSCLTSSFLWREQWRTLLHPPGCCRICGWSPKDDGRTVRHLCKALIWWLLCGWLPLAPSAGLWSP